MKIATWNVNSIRARISSILEWVDQAVPDVLLLQETKCREELFPKAPFQERGYQIAVVGEPSLNGVALLSKFPIEELTTSLPGDIEDKEARYIEGLSGGVRVISVYVPNGTALDSARFPFKLAFLDRLRLHAASLLERDEPLVIGGDYNVAPEPEDVYDAKELEGTICYHPAEREKLRALMYLGLYDAFRATQPDVTRFSWWHYQGRSFQLGHGLRIDHLLLSSFALDRLTAADIDSSPRHAKTPSDHAPVWCSLEL